jgi:hypothetical protein
MRRMRLARLARLGVIRRRVPVPTAVDRDSSSASTDTIVQSRTPACCTSEGTVATTRLNPRPAYSLLRGDLSPTGLSDCAASLDCMKHTRIGFDR